MKEKIFWICLALAAFNIPVLATALAPPVQWRVLQFAPGQIAVAPPVPQLELGAAFTLEAWVFVEKFQPWAYLLGKTDPTDGDPYWSYLLALSADGSHVQFVQTTGRSGEISTVQSPAGLPLRTWTHIAGTLAGGTLRLFVNGVEVASGQSFGPPAPNPLPFGVGGCVYGSGGPNANFTGALRQIRVWNRALSADELKANANRQLTGTETGLLACWPLDDGSGQNARDLGPNHLPLQRGVAATADSNDPRWMHTVIVDQGPFFTLVDPLVVLPSPSAPGKPTLNNGFVIDFDSDGIPDILLSTCYWSDIRRPYAPVIALHNDGQGHFTDVTAAICPGARIRGGNGTHVVADFNDDGRQDIFIVDGGETDNGADAAGSPCGQNRLFLQTADGRLEDVSATRLPQRNLFTHCSAGGDFDGDGFPDIFVGSIGGPTTSGLASGSRLLRNDSHGHFSRGVEGLPYDILRSSGAAGCAAIDVNRDGRPDLAIGGGVWPNHDTLLLNDGQGNLVLAPENSLPLSDPGSPDRGAAGQYISTGDLDGDDWPDLLYFREDLEGNQPARWCLYLNNRDGTFRDAGDQISFNPEVPQGGAPSRIDELNGDGKLDFILAVSKRLFLNTGGAHFVEANEFWPPNLPGLNILTADFDGDGDTDVALIESFGQSVWLLRQVKAPSLDLLVEPTAPSNLTATLASTTQVNLAWHDNAGPKQGFIVERRTGGGAFAELARVADGVTTYSDTGLVPGKTYAWRVSAWNAAGPSAPSNEAAATTFLVGTNFTVGGFVGVGLASPERAVHIRGPNAVFRMDRSKDTAAFMITRSDDAGATLKTFVVGVNAAGPNAGSFVVNDLGPATSGSGTTRLTIASDGRAEFGGQVFARGFVTSSSRRLKTGIAPLAGAPDLLRQLQGFRFTWKAAGEQAAGFNAEDAARAATALAVFSGGAPVGIDYARLTPLLIAELVEGVKSQQRQLEALRQRRDRLQSRLDERRRAKTGSTGWVDESYRPQNSEKTRRADHE